MKKAKLDPYIRKEDLLKEIQTYKKSGEITENLGNMLIKIATRYCSKPNFSNYSYKDDFIAEAVSRMVEQLNKIDLKHPKTNPFAYLTQICHFKFVAKINTEHKYQQTKLKIKEHYIYEFEHSEGIRMNKNDEDQDMIPNTDKTDYDELIDEETDNDDNMNDNE